MWNTAVGQHITVKPFPIAVGANAPVGPRDAEGGVPYKRNKRCGVHRAWFDVRPAGGPRPSPTKHRRNPNHVCRGGGLPRPHAAPVPCRPSASGTALLEPIRSTSRQFPMCYGRNLKSLGGGVGARRVKPRRRGRLGSQSGEQTCLRPGSALQKVPHRRLFFLTPARRILSFRQGRKERMGVAKAQGLGPVQTYRAEWCNPGSNLRGGFTAGGTGSAWPG